MLDSLFATDSQGTEATMGEVQCGFGDVARSVLSRYLRVELLQQRLLLQLLQHYYD